MGDPEARVMARPLRAPLRRSFSDHIRDSTARALDVIWKNTRDRRLAGKDDIKGKNLNTSTCYEHTVPWLNIKEKRNRIAYEEIKKI
ncbi:hypothetical protein G4228_018267 [Cervus hanglu yarkandensis]|nr:hypothetical protein G4228_018267 [Cervus hanglu yarkandensis]